MTLEPASLNALIDHGFDTLIDVRSPAEYAEDHIPGAINLPALSDAERAEVGTIYVQDSPFRARKIGAAMVARNVATYLDGPLAKHGGGWRPLVYCWRGGQRSGSVAAILSQIGWRAETVKGGYQAFRRLVVSALYDTPWPGQVALLDGNTGTAKTEILAAVAGLGHQTLDLERLANHRGSLFGGMQGPQPSQKAFETAIAQVLVTLDPARPLLLEAESSKIGELLIPPSLWKAMREAPRLSLSVPIAERASYLVRAYADLAADTSAATGQLEELRRFHGRAQVAAWIEMLEAGELHLLAAELMEQHYDPRYAKSRLRAGRRDTVVSADSLDAAGITALAKEVASWLNAL